MCHKYKITVAVITMNRSKQLKHALESCIDSELPENTQFLVVDNASTDDTEKMISLFKESIKYDLVYHKEDINRGVGGGRNICFDLAEGEYVYFLDDDAEIAEECRKTFFTKSIENMDKHPQIATLTTDVVDKVFGDRSQIIAKNMKAGELNCTYTFHGGTVFVRKAAFSSPLFMDIMYGNEEITLSMDAVNRGYVNAYDPSIYINHYPKNNKWQGNSLEFLYISGINNTYNIKRLQYPSVFLPLLYMAYKKRLHMYSGNNKEYIRSCEKKSKEFLKNNKVKKIKFSTVIKCYKEFGLTVF